MTATASYRLLPEITITKPCEDNLADKLVLCFSEGVIKVENEHGMLKCSYFGIFELERRLNELIIYVLLILVVYHLPLTQTLRMAYLVHKRGGRTTRYKVHPNQLNRLKRVEKLHHLKSEPIFSEASQRAISKSYWLPWALLHHLPEFCVFI